MRVVINFRLLAVVVVSGLLLALGVHLLHGYQTERNTEALRRQAEHAREKGNPGRAAELMHRYLLAKPGQNEVRSEYGRLLEEIATSTADAGARNRTLRSAASVYEEVLLREPEQHDIRRKFATITTQLGEWDRALPSLEPLAEVFPDDGELEFMLGRCYEAKGQLRKAAEWYDRANRDAPHPIASYVRLAVLLRDKPEALGEMKRSADQVMDDLIARHPRSPHAYLERALYRKKAEPAKACEDLAEALRLAPDEADVRLVAADLAREQDRPDEERDHLEAGVKRHPRDFRFYLALAAAEERTGNRAKAADWLQRGLQELPGRGELLWPLADLVVGSGSPKEAQDAIDALSKSGWPAAQVDYLKGRLLVREGNWAKARQLLEPTRQLLADAPELVLQTDLLLGRCYERMGDPERQVAAYRRAALLDAQNPAVRQGLSSALLGQGKIDDAIREHRRLTDLPNAPASAWTGLARLLVLRNLSRPSDVPEWQEADRILDRAAQLDPESVDVLMLRVEGLVARKEFEKAHDLLQAAGDRRPDRAELWAARADLAVKRGEPADAQRILDRAAAKLGDHVELRLARARTLLGRPAAQAVPELLKLAERTENFRPEDRERLLGQLAEQCAHLGQLAEATRLLDEAAELRPNDLRARFRLFELALQAGDKEAMERRLEALRRIEGADEPMGRYATACRMIWLAQKENDRRFLGTAREQLQQVALQRPGWHRVPLSLAEIDELEGNSERALENYRSAIQLGERGPRVRHVVELLRDRRRFADAEEVIRKLLEKGPLSPDLKKLAAEISVGQQDYALALERAEAAAAGSSNYKDHIWLGQLRWAAGRRKEAEGPFRDAVKLAGDKQPEPWVALVRHLARTSQADEAEKVIAAAKGQLPAAVRALALGQCYEALGHPVQAEEHYLAALSAQPDDVPLRKTVAEFYLQSGQPTKAEPHLRRLADPRGAASADDRLFARRRLAVVLMADPNAHRFREALELVERNLEEERNRKDERNRRDGGVEDQRIKAAVLALWPNRHREAIALLEESSGKLPGPTPNLQFLLVLLYELDGNGAKAREQMSALLAAHGDNPRFVAHHIDSSIRRGRASEGAIWLDKLKELLRPNPLLASLEARLLAAQEQGEAAVRAMENYVASKNAEPADANERALHAAAVLGDLDREFTGARFGAVRSAAARAAEDLYRKLLTQTGRPQNALALASFLAQRGRIAEAVELCDKAWEGLPPEVAAMSCVAIVVRAGDVKGPAARRLEQRLTQALQKQPQSVILMTARAHLCEAQGRYDDTEKLYRGIIVQDARNVPALNNLAYLLALRGQPREALELVDRAIEQLGETPDLLDTRAVARLAAREGDRALRDLQESISGVGDRALRDLWESVGGVSMTLRSFRMPYAEQASRNPKALQHFHLAQARQLKGDAAGAAEAFKQARAQGLSEDDLHPLERETFRRMSKELTEG